MGSGAGKKDRRDTKSKGAALRGKKPAAKAAAPAKKSTNSKSKPTAKSAKDAKAEKAAKSVNSKNVESKSTPERKSGLQKAPLTKAKAAVSSPAVESKKQGKEVPAKKIAAPKKANIGNSSMTQVQATKSEGTVIRSLSKGAEQLKIKEGHCPNCNVFSNCRRREFSEQAMTVLLLWGEITPASVDQAICDDCYDELREVLIDRADEVDAALSGKGVDRVREMVSKAAS